MKRIFAGSALAALLSATALPLWAQDLIIGRAAEQSSIDPQFSRTGNNQMTASMIFGRLLESDSNLQMTPGLAVSWEVVDPLTWDITLREGVTFHDGAPLTVEDVIYSLERAPNVPNSPAPFTDMVAAVASLEKTGDLGLRVVTKAPAPTLMEDLGRVFIVRKDAVDGKSSEDFATGDAAIGTGPYRYVSWTPGETLKVAAFDGYWGAQPEFKDVEIRFISNDAARVAALLSGAVHLIDAVPAADVPRLAGDAAFHVDEAASGRLIYFALSMRDAGLAVGTTDLAGNPLPSNPFMDARVRKSLSLMIDRQLVIDRILGGAGFAANQLVPPALGGHAADIPAITADIPAAKALLAEAGYPDGFGITVYSSNDRFPGDGDLAQALAQMFTRGGLKVNGVEVYPYNVYAKSATDGGYGSFVFSLGSSTPTSAPNLQSLLHTYDREANKGGFNRARYANAAFDEALSAALQEFDEARRMELLEEATRLVFADTPIIPLYWQKLYWASKAGITINAGLNEYTVPQDIESVK